MVEEFQDIVNCLVAEIAVLQAQVEHKNNRLKEASQLLKASSTILLGKQIDGDELLAENIKLRRENHSLKADNDALNRALSRSSAVNLLLKIKDKELFGKALAHTITMESFTKLASDLHETRNLIRRIKDSLGLTNEQISEILSKKSTGDNLRRGYIDTPIGRIYFR